MAATGIALLACLAVVAPASAAPVAGTEIELGQGTHASAMTAGRDGNIWFAGIRIGYSGKTDVVGRVSPSGEVTEFPLPPRPERELGLDSIVAARDGYLYFTETGASRIGRISTGGQFDDFALPAPASRPRSIVEAPDGKLWIAEEGVDRVASIDNESGILSEYQLPPGSAPSGVAVRADGTAWVTETGLAKLGAIAPDDSVRSFELRDRQSRPNAIVPGPEGNLWFTDLAKPRLGRVTAAVGTKGEYEWLDLNWGTSTDSIVFGPRGDFWYTTGNRIGSVSPSWGLGEPACVSGGCSLPVTALAVGPEGDLWYGTGVQETEGGGGTATLNAFAPGRIGKFEPPPLSFAIGKRAGRLAGHYISLRIDCRGGAAGQYCDGTVRVSARLPKPPGAERSERKVVGSAGVEFHTSSGRRFRLRLSRRAAAVVAQRGRLQVHVTATTTDGKQVSREMVLHPQRREPKRGTT